MSPETQIPVPKVKPVIQPTPASAPLAKKPSSGLYELFRTVVIAFLIALLVRTFAYEPFSIPSGSMFPNLLVGDYLFVAKYAYGYSYHSLPLSLPLFSGKVMAKMPRRGDVVVFKLPSDNKTDYVKRVIGLPGDHIQVIDGVLNINYQPVKREFIRKVEILENNVPVQVIEYMETLPGGVRHRIWERNDISQLDNTPVYDVPNGYYFMMGDNRDNSIDSRVIPPMQAADNTAWSLQSHREFVSEKGVGFVPEINLEGRATILFFSLKEGTNFYEVWKWPLDLRPSRFFMKVK